jgi:hypothetical protein
MASDSKGIAEGHLVFRTAADVAALGSPDVPWVVRPWVAKGAVTEIDGRVKAAGKTTFIAAMVRAVLDGAPFLDQPTSRTCVVGLTEQPPTSFLEVLRRADLLDRQDLYILFWHEARGVPWEAVVTAAIAEAQKRGAGLLVVDTLPQFAGLRGDSENYAGEALAALAPLQIAAAQGLAVLIARHERKGGGDVGESGRGSSAFAGAADIVIALRRPEGRRRPTIREIQALSRFDETPDSLMVELDGSRYKALGTGQDLALQEARKAILDELPRGEGDALPIEELLKKTDGVKRTVAQDALEGLMEAGQVVRIGKGVRGDPCRYHRPDNGEGDDSSRRNSHPEDGSNNLKTLAARYPL